MLAQVVAARLGDLGLPGRPASTLGLLIDDTDNPVVVPDARHLFLRGVLRRITPGDDAGLPEILVM